MRRSGAGRQLLTVSQVFDDKILPATESADHLAKEMPDRHKNLIGTVRIELFAKSFILWAYDLLARHSTSFEPSLCHPPRCKVEPSSRQRV